MKTLIVTSCTASKSLAPGLIKASERYIGPTFRASICESHRTHSDLALVSAEFGFILPNTKVPYYDTVLKGSVPTKKEDRHLRVVPTNDKGLQELVLEPLTRSILEHQSVVVFLPSHYLRVVEKAMNPHISRCKFRMMVKRPGNQIFSMAVIAGERSITPSRRYQDVLDNSVRCARCSRDLQDIDKVELRRGKLVHSKCRSSSRSTNRS